MDLAEKFIIIAYILGSIIGAIFWEVFLRSFFIKCKKKWFAEYIKKRPIY